MSTSSGSYRLRNLDTGETFSYEIVADELADPATGQYSESEPLSTALVGKGASEEVVESVLNGQPIRVKIDAFVTVEIDGELSS